jgi:hypothetical protein
MSMNPITPAEVLRRLKDPIYWIAKNVLSFRNEVELKEWVFCESASCAELIAAAINFGSCTCFEQWQCFGIQDEETALGNCQRYHSFASLTSAASRDEFINRAVLGNSRAHGPPVNYMNDFRRGMLVQYLRDPRTGAFFQVGAVVRCTQTGCRNHVGPDDQCPLRHPSSNPYVKDGRFRCHRDNCDGEIAEVSRCPVCRTIFWDHDPPRDPATGKSVCSQPDCPGKPRAERRCRSCEKLCWQHEPIWWLWVRGTREAVEVRRCMNCLCLFFQRDDERCPGCGNRNWSPTPTIVWMKPGLRGNAQEVVEQAPDEAHAFAEALEREAVEDAIHAWPVADAHHRRLRAVAGGIFLAERSPDEVAQELDLDPGQQEFRLLLLEAIDRLPPEIRRTPYARDLIREFRRQEIESWPASDPLRPLARDLFCDKTFHQPEDVAHADEAAGRRSLRPRVPKISPAVARKLDEVAQRHGFRLRRRAFRDAVTCICQRLRISTEDFRAPRQGRD